jgi:HAD superfamily hydrolase (TIGR01509 family)
LRSVIFDVDGTLIDSNDAHARAWVDSLAEAGHHVPFDRVRPLIGMGGDKVLPELTGIEEDAPEGRQIAERRSAIFRERYMPHLQPLPGAADLVTDLRARGHRVAVASSAKGEELGHLLAIAGVKDLVEERTSSSDADASKPDPDIIQATLERLGCGPADAIMVGDTPYDIEAARRAGMDTIAFRSGGWGDEGLAGAVAIYDNAADLLERYEQSVLAQR